MLNLELIDEIEEYYKIRTIIQLFFKELKIEKLEYKKSYFTSNVFECYIEELIKKHFNDKKLFNYIKHPNGSHKKPDFLIEINNNLYKDINIECKSGQNLKPTWNCSLPEDNIIYIFYCYHKKYNKICIFTKNMIISEKEYNLCKQLSHNIKDFCKKLYKEQKAVWN